MFSSSKPAWFDLFRPIISRLSRQTACLSTVAYSLRLSKSKSQLQFKLFLMASRLWCKKWVFQKFEAINNSIVVCWKQPVCLKNSWVGKTSRYKSSGRAKSCLYINTMDFFVSRLIKLLEGIFLSLECLKIIKVQARLIFWKYFIAIYPRKKISEQKESSNV